MTTNRQTQTRTIEDLGYALEDLDIAPSVMTTLANMEAARQDSRSLTPEDRAAYVAEICRALKLNPLTRPVQFLALQGREVLYLTRGATDQLAARHGLNRETLEGPDFRVMEGVKVAFCKVKATLPSGRFEVSTATLKVTSPADDLMKVETKSKRRATLSILGIGVLSEEEAESVAATESANDRRETQRRTETRPAANDAAMTLPRDNGLTPSQAAAALAAPDTVDHYDLAARLIDGASTLPELAAAWGVIARDHIPHLGPNERTAIVAAKDARKAALPAAPPPSDDPPPDGPTKPRRGPRKAAQGDAAADSPAAPPGASAVAQDGPAAWLATEEETTAHAATLTTEWAVQASARKHNAALASTPWGVRVYAQRLQAMGFGTESQCVLYVSAWCAAGPVARATARRRAA